MSQTSSSSLFSGASKYILDEELAKIVNISMALEMPLLLKGEPGTGKTMLAHAISEALNIARSISTPHNISFNELLQPQNLEVEAWRDEVIDLAASVKNSLTNMTDEHFVSKTISAVYYTPPYSDLVNPQICFLH